MRDIDHEGLTFKALLKDIGEREDKRDLEEKHTKYAKARCDKCAKKSFENLMFHAPGRLCENCYAKRHLTLEDYNQYKKWADYRKQPLTAFQEPVEAVEGE